MLSEPMLGAFLSLLIDHYVQEHEVADKLQPTQAATALQLDQMWVNSPVLQFLNYLASQDPKLLDFLPGQEVDPLINSFMAWRLNEGFSELSSADVGGLFKECFELTWKTARVNGTYVRKRVIHEVKPETHDFLARLKEGVADVTAQAAGPVVDD